MRFRITGVPQQDPIHIRTIRIIQDQKNTLLEIRNDQITDLEYNIPVTLSRDTTSYVKVYVEMKNGRKITSVKVYKVP